MTGGGWIRHVEVDPGPPDSFPFSIPAVRDLRRLELDPAVTILVGGNGSGKSTLLEAIAQAAGFNPEGGSRNFNFATREDSTSALHRHLRLVRPPGRPRTGFFLRAESFFNVATQVEQLDDPEIRRQYGSRSLHEQSHGESFLSLVTNRFGRDGLYLLDEPESALSPMGCMALLARMHDLVGEGSQFLLATHSPLLMAYPGALVHELDEDGIHRRPYDQTATFTLFRSFLEDPERYLHHLFGSP